MNSKVIFIVAIIITVTIAGIGIYYLHLPSTQTSQAQENVQIMSYTRYIENNSVQHFLVIGEVKNNLTTNVKSLAVNAIFYDEEGHVIGTQHAYSALEILKPEQKSPFKIYVHPNLSASEDIKLTCTCFKTNDEPVTGFDISKEEEAIDDDGYYIVSGETQNNGPRKASKVRAICTFYDSSQRVIGMSGTLISLEMNVGDNSTFTITSKPCKYPSSYELVIAADYEPLFDMRYPLFFTLVIIFVIFVVFMKRRGW